MPARRIALAICLILGAWPHLVLAAEEPSFQVGFPKWGDTPRVCEYSWCRVPIEIRNPTDLEQEVVFTLRAANGAEALYSKQVRIGPRAAIKDTLYLVAERTRDYYATLNYLDGRQIQNQPVISDFQNPYRTVPAYFVTDDPELEGVSALAKDKELGKRLIVTRSRGADLPDHVQGFGSASLVVLVGTDFRTMNGAQFRAIEDFVASGGTLAIVRAQTVVDASATPLAHLSPVLPLAVRRIDRMPELTTWEGQVAPVDGTYWKRGMSFLETVPRESAVVALKHGAHPAITWGSWGLGRVVVCSFDPFVEGCRETDASRRLWRHILSVVRQHPIGGRAMYEDAMEQVAGKLIGFKVPSSDTIRNIMVAYFALILALFALGSVMRRQVLGWLAAAALSLILTGIILTAADRQLDQQKPRNAITVDLLCQAPEGQGAASVGEAFVNMVNRSDDRPDISGQSPGVWIRPNAPPPATAPVSGKGSTVLSIVRDDSSSKLVRLDVRENKATKFYTVYDGFMPEPFQTPLLTNGRNGMILRDCVLPPGRKISRLKAYLLLSNGFQELRSEKDSFTLPAGGGVGVELDTVAGQFEKFLAAAELPAPAVAFFYRAQLPFEHLQFGDGGYAQERHLIHLLPLRLNLVPGPVKVPCEDILLEPADKSSRALYWEGQWQRTQLYGDSNSYLFAARVPVAYRNMRLDSATVDLAVVNPSQTVTASAELVPYGQTVGKRELSAIEATRVNGQRAEFDDLEGKALLNPVDGRLLIKLTVSSSVQPDVRRRRGQGVDRKLVIQEWRIAEFSVELNGALRSSRDGPDT